MKMPIEHLRDFKKEAADQIKSGEERTATWLDPKTGLEWQYECAGEMSWSNAMEYARSLSLNGKDDWRLPSAMELETLLDRRSLYDTLRPVTREDVPFNDRFSYWSSTTFQQDTKSAWIVMFDGAYVLSYYKNNKYRVRCVRG